MKRSEAYHILHSLYRDATATQQEALNIAQNDIQTIDLIGGDVLHIVRCKDCKEHQKCKLEQRLGWYGYCSEGERRCEE